MHHRANITPKNIATQDTVKPSYAEYAAAQAKAHRVNTEAAEAFESAKSRGDLDAARNTVEQLEGISEELKRMRAQFTPQELLIGKYSIEAHDANTVSLIIPKGLSRLELIQDVERMQAAGEFPEQGIIDHESFVEWEIKMDLAEVVREDLRIKITGAVQGGDSLSRRKQVAFLTKKGFVIAPVEDAVVAHAAMFGAIGTDLFAGVWAVRVDRGTLQFAQDGIRAVINKDKTVADYISVAAAVP